MLLGPAISFLFTEDDRYLLAYRYNAITTVDLASGTTMVQPADFANAHSWANPLTGVTLVEGHDETRHPLSARGSAQGPGAVCRERREQPLGSAAVYAVFGAPTFVRLDPTATPRPIGNRGTILGISDRHVFFRDLDGICALSF